MTIPTELSEFLARESQARRRGSSYSLEDQIEADTAYYEALSYEPLQKYLPCNFPTEVARDDYFCWRSVKEGGYYDPGTFAEWLVRRRAD